MIAHDELVWSDEQRQVIESKANVFTVKAAAGSGKTSVLVDRYIRFIVDDNLTPEEIVTVTYTRRAASEMKSRIIRRLRKMGRLEDAQRAETGPIQTIHGLCERILRENAVEAGIDPEFEILGTAQARSLEFEAITQAIVAAKEDSEYASALIHIHSCQSGWKSNKLHGQLRNLVGSLVERMRSAGFDPQELEANYSSPDSILRFWKQELLALLPEEVSSFATDDTDYGWVQGVRTQLKLMNYRVPSWLKFRQWQEEVDAANDTCGLVWLALSAWSYLDQIMVQRQEFDFTMLEAKAIDLLQNSATTRERIQNQCKVLMVDEAQDLNPLQYKLIECIQAQNEMLVGDPQQSIFSFRFADRRLFIDRCSRTQTYNLSKNFRSEKGVLAFVDEVFKSMWANEYVPYVSLPEDDEVDDPFGSLAKNDFEGIEIWPMPARQTPSIVEMTMQLLEEGWRPEQIAILVKDNALGADLKEKLLAAGAAVRTVGTSSTFFTRLEVRDLANVLEALADPYQDYQLLAVLRSPFVELSLDCVTYLASTRDVFLNLSNPGPWEHEDQAKIDEFLVWFNQLRETVDRLPAWESITLLLRNTPFLVNSMRTGNGSQVLANIRKLHNLAMNEPKLNARDYVKKIREIQSLTHQEGDAPIIDENANAITISTIHRSKGLEFDLVILADTHGMSPGKSNLVQTDSSRGLVAYASKGKALALEMLQDRSKVAAKEEMQRLLYVAMTRAKKKLCLVVTETSGGTNMAQILAGASGIPKAIKAGIIKREVAPLAVVD